MFPVCMEIALGYNTYTQLILYLLILSLASSGLFRKQ